MTFFGTQSANKGQIAGIPISEAGGIFMPFALNATPFQATTTTTALEKSTTLYIKAKGSVVDYEFEPNEIIVGKEATLTINVAPDRGHDTSKIRIYSYCASDTDIRRVRAESIREINSTKLIPVAATYEEQKEPYRGDIEEVTIGFYLEDRQLVSVGLIVELTRKNGDIEYYLCDPQVGNGPPGIAKFSSAVQLFL
jgi:hypothetical protein